MSLPTPNRTQLALVGDPHTPPETLRILWFAFPYDIAFRRQIAAHPNLTPELAARCLGKHPEVVCRNPVFPLLLVECPNLIDLVPAKDLLRCLSHEDCPRLFLELMLQRRLRLVSEAAKRHVRLAGPVPPQELETTLREELLSLPIGDRECLEQLRAAGMVPRQVLDRLQLPPAERREVGSQEPPDLEEIPLTDAEEALLERALTQPPSWMGIPWAIIDRQGLPFHVLERLCRHGEGGYNIVSKVLSHPKTSPELYRLATASAVCYRAKEAGLAFTLALAQAPVGYWLGRYVRAVSWHRRLVIALNPQTSQSALLQLAHDGNRIVRAVAQRRQEDPSWGLMNLT